jgi:hypothetical protein
MTACCAPGRPCCRCAQAPRLCLPVVLAQRLACRPLCSGSKSSAPAALRLQACRMTQPSEHLGLTVHSLPTPVDAMTPHGPAAAEDAAGLAACAAPVIAVLHLLRRAARPVAHQLRDLIQPTVPMPACRRSPGRRSPQVPRKACRAVAAGGGGAAPATGLRAAVVRPAPVARDDWPRARPHRQGVAGHRRRAGEAGAAQALGRHARHARCCACPARSPGRWLVPAPGQRWKTTSTSSTRWASG